MTTVILVNSLAVLFAFLAKYKHLRFCLFVSLFLIFIFLGLRYDFGNDYNSYLKYYLKVKSGYKNFELDKEVGWYYLNYYFRNISYFALILFVSFIYFLSFYLFIKRFVLPKYYALAVFILTFDPDNLLIQLSAIRQTLAICLIIFGLLFYFKNKKIILPILFSLAAISIHTSSALYLVIFFVIFLFKNIKFNNRYIFYTLASSLVLFSVTGFLMSLFPIVPNEYELYIDQQQAGASIGFGALISYIFFFLFLSHDNLISKENKLYYRLAEVSYFFAPVKYIYSMFGRVLYYFSVFNVIAFPMLIERIKNKGVKVFTVVLLIVYILYKFFTFFESGIYGDYYKVYKTIFDIPYYF